MSFELMKQITMVFISLFVIKYINRSIDMMSTNFCYYLIPLPSFVAFRTQAENEV